MNPVQVKGTRQFKNQSQLSNQKSQRHTCHRSGRPPTWSMIGTTDVSASAIYGLFAIVQMQCVQSKIEMRIFGFRMSPAGNSELIRRRRFCFSRVSLFWSAVLVVAPSFASDSAEESDVGLQSKPLLALELPFSERSLESIADTHPTLHAELVSSDWESLDANDRFTRISPLLRRLWGADNIYASVNDLEVWKTSPTDFKIHTKDLLPDVLTRGVQILLSQVALESMIQEWSRRDEEQDRKYFGRVSSELVDQREQCRIRVRKEQRACSLTIESTIVPSVFDCFERSISTRKKMQSSLPLFACFQIEHKNLQERFEKCGLSMILDGYENCDETAFAAREAYLLEKIAANQ